MPDRAVQMPSDVSSRVGFFDKFAGWAAQFASRAPFFAFCVLLIVLWAPSFTFLKFDTWQLIINTATTIITFLLVALLQNSQTRNDQATQHKLNAMADALADFMESFSRQFPEASLDQDIWELKLAVGLEEHESTTHNGNDDDDSDSDSDTSGDDRSRDDRSREADVRAGNGSWSVGRDDRETSPAR